MSFEAYPASVTEDSSLLGHAVSLCE